MRCTFLFVFALTATVVAQSPATTAVEKAERDAAVEALATKLGAGYVLADISWSIIQALRSANSTGEYDGKAPKEFVDAVNRTLVNASHDKHLAVFYQPVTQGAGAPSLEQRERLNFGFGKLERLRGNVGYLEILNFADLRQQSAETASALLSTLANFDAIIIDRLRVTATAGRLVLEPVLAALLLAAIPIYQARDGRRVEAARISARTIGAIRADLATLPPSGLVLFHDEPDISAFREAFGDLASEALRTRTRFGRDWDARIENSAPKSEVSVRRGAIIADYWIEHGRIIRAGERCPF
ncbi:MAG TPA: hypothetical protein VK137_19425 [Planctomycetaceae bacterium]|nr:hypothetical protein [Planctomycetaceae bacterium]